MRASIARSVCVASLTSLTLLLPHAVPADDGAGNAQRGREIATTHCTRCHVVGNYNPSGGISSTPSFQILLKRRPDWLNRFETFYVRPPHPAFLAVAGLGRKREDLPPNAHPIAIEPQQVDDIVAFVKTMKAGKKVVAD